MKAVNFKTSHILLRAYTTDAYNFCNYAIIKVTEDWLERVRKAGGQVAALKEEDSFAHLSYYEGKTDFYNIEEESEADSVLDSEKEWSFIEISDEELEDLELVEERLEIHKIHFTRFEDLSVTAYGKCSGSEYYTTDIKISELLSTL